MRPCRFALAALGAGLVAAASACPVDTVPRAASVLLTVQSADTAATSWNAERLRALGVQAWTEKRSVERAGQAHEQSISYQGVRLRDVLAADIAALTTNDRALRTAVFEAVASDGYRAVFSWGELFNGEAGERTIVVLAVDGQPLDARQGPLALRALADTRPGPRHVRNLCALRVHGPR